MTARLRLLFVKDPVQAECEAEEEDNVGRADKKHVLDLEGKIN